MANDRYVPRRFAIDDQLFGKERVIKWRPQGEFDGLELDRWRASRMQHLAACIIREVVGQSARYFSIADYARAADVSERRMASMLRGEVVMRLEDLATAERLLKVTWIGWPGSRD